MSLRAKQGDVIGGRYRLEEKIGHGGFAEVWAAQHVKTAKAVALKVFHPWQVRDDPTSLQRFTQEARLSNQLGSPYFVDVYDADVDVDTGIPWIAMERLRGADLDRMTADDKLLPMEIVTAVLRQLGQAIGLAHEATPNPVAHLDLKPENLFWHHTGLDGDQAAHLKVLDLGIARLLPEDRTVLLTRKVYGSLLYMAPEQMHMELRRECDVWAIGLIAFTLITGRTYWESAHNPHAGRPAYLLEIAYNPLEPASQRARKLGALRELPDGFDAWFAQCVNRDVSARIKNARLAIDALLPLLRPSVAPGDATAVSFARAERDGDDDQIISLGHLLLRRAHRDDLVTKVADAYLRRATRRGMERDSVRALEDLEAALSLCPDRVDLRVLRATIRCARGELDGALDDARTVLSRDPASADGHALLASVHRARGEWSTAVTLWSAALALSPDRADVLAARASGFLAVTLPHAARADAQQALALSPSHAAAHEALVRALDALGLSDEATKARAGAAPYQGTERL